MRGMEVEIGNVKHSFKKFDFDRRRDTGQKGGRCC